MRVWTTLKQALWISFIGFSLFSTSFIISLLLGTAAIHPVLGPTQQLVLYVQIIVLTSVILALVNQLQYVAPPRKTYTAPRREKIYSTQ